MNPDVVASGGMRRPDPWIGLSALLGLLASWPFRSMLTHLPWTPDGTKWFLWGQPGHPEWFTWTFLSRHFVGYRPLTALSFTGNALIGGLDPLGFRLTDLLLHALVATGVATLFRALAGRSTPWALFAAAVFLAHPVGEEVVVHLARRSYLLAGVFTTFGMASFLHAHARDRTPWFAGLLLLAGVLSNEVTYACLPVLPLLAAWCHPTDRRTLLRHTSPLAAVLAVGLALRLAVLGTVGGYQRAFVAGLQSGRKVTWEVTGFHGPEIFAQAMTYTWFPMTSDGLHHPLWSQLFVLGVDVTPLVRLGLLVVVVSLVWSVLIAPLLPRQRGGHGVIGLLVLWMLGLAVLFAATGTWFWRQAYPMAIPFALIATWAVRHAFQRRLRLQGALWLTVLTTLVADSSLIRGLSAKNHHARATGNAMIAAVRQRTPPPPAIVHVVSALNLGPTVEVVDWLNRIEPSPEVRYRPLAHGVPPTPVRLESTSLVLDSRTRLIDPGASLQAGRRFPLAWLAGEHPAFVVYPDGDQMHWVEVPR